MSSYYSPQIVVNYVYIFSAFMLPSTGLKFQLHYSNNPISSNLSVASRWGLLESSNIDAVILAQNYLTFIKEDKQFPVLIDSPMSPLPAPHNSFFHVLQSDHHLPFDNTSDASVFPQVTVNSPATESSISHLAKLIGNVT